MLKYEKELRDNGFDLIIGVDEAGRGPLAGPVVAAAVVLESFSFVNRVDDSKKLTHRQREKAAIEIKNKSLYALASVSHSHIDKINILRASNLAMQKAISKLAAKIPQDKRVFVIIDGNTHFKLDFPCRAIIKGDGKSLSIAAASILAKVRRDRIMEAYDKLYPGYGFMRHKGYSTKLHRNALKNLGPVAIHRRSFLKCLRG